MKALKKKLGHAKVDLDSVLEDEEADGWAAWATHKKSKPLTHTHAKVTLFIQMPPSMFVNRDT